MADANAGERLSRCGDLSKPNLVRVPSHWNLQPELVAIKHRFTSSMPMYDDLISFYKVLSSVILVS